MTFLTNKKRITLYANLCYLFIYQTFFVGNIKYGNDKYQGQHRVKQMESRSALKISIFIVLLWPDITIYVSTM